MISGGFRSEDARQLEAAVSVRRAHLRDFKVLVAQTSDTTGPFPLDRRGALEFEAQLLEKVYRHSEVFDDDPDPFA